jgi:hypothetical protein
MKLVIFWSQIWRLSDRNYRRMLKAYVDGHTDHPNPGAYGGRFSGLIDKDLTDIDREEAADELK